MKIGSLLGYLIPYLVILVTGQGCSRPAGGRIAIMGSDTMVGLGQRWAEEFMKANPDVIVSVTGGGSGTGITALIQGSCDIAQASRRIEETEMQAARKAGREIHEHVVAWDGIAVIVHPSNQICALTLAELSDIYQGKVTHWRQLGGKNCPIVLLARETSSGTHVFFKERVLQLDKKRPQADYATSAILCTSSQAIHDEVAANPNAVGYVGIAYVDAKVKAVSVSEKEGLPYVAPSVESIRNHTYPIARPLYLYTAGDPTEAVVRFLRFVRSDQGQAIVQEQGFIPVPEEETPAPTASASKVSAASKH